MSTYAFWQGLGLILTLIVAIGPQNIFVLRHAVRRQHVAFTSFITGCCDSILLIIGILGVGRLMAAHPLAQILMLWLGVAFLYAYGLRCLYRTWRPEPLSIDFNGPAIISKWRITATAMAFTFLNPHAMLDFFVILGGIAAQYPENARLAFLGGAILGSNLWFWTLGLAGRLMSRWFQNQIAWRWLDAIIGAFMWLLATNLLLMT
jgi:L-lysine exporter family protein LysE/ArgO